MTAFRFAALIVIVALGAPLPAQAQTEERTAHRAAVLVYRQTLHPDGGALGLAARLMTERARVEGQADAEALERLRERVLEAARDLEHQAPTTPGVAGDQVAALVARQAETGFAAGPRRLLAAWRERENRKELEGLLPYLLVEAESSAGEIWQAALDAAGDDEALAQALAPLVSELTGAGLQAPLSEWLAASPALDPDSLSVSPGEAWRDRVRSRLASALADPADVSPVITARLRAQWFLASRTEPADAAGLALAGLWIGLRANTGSLQTGDPVGFLAALIDGAQRLAMGGEPLSAAQRRELAATVDLLEDIPADVVEDWTAVDRRLPGIYRSVLGELSEAAGNGATPSAAGLLMAGARLTLLDDDWEAYLMQPFREPIQRGLTECLPVKEASAAGCRVRFQDWGLQGAAIPEASGDVGGPFQTQYLLRELDLNPWQRVNYLRGFWRELLARECTSRSRIRNALEWSLAARAFLATLPEDPAPEDDAIQAGLDRLAEAGESLVGDLKEFGACRVQGRGPIRQVLDAYLGAVNRLSGVLKRADRAFQDEILVAGADIDLDAGPDQDTDYAPLNITVGPCDATPSCGVALELAASPDLFHRFPGSYRVAHQSGLGSLSICYNEVSWVNRRAEPVKAGGQVMANYQGNLGFRLRGRYQAGGETRDVFVIRLVSEKAHTYLFAPDQSAVLADPCPQEYQGRMAVGELPEARGWLVPRRLTFLSGERRSPARLFVENWARGEAWRERLASGEGVTLERAAAGDEVAGSVRDHLEGLRERRRAHLFERLLAPMASDGETQAARDLTATAQELAALQRALDASVRVLMPRTAMHDPRRRGVLYGDEALVGTAGIRAWRDRGGDPMALPDHARERVERAIAAWRALAGGTELPPFVAHALIDLLAARAPADGP